MRLIIILITCLLFASSAMGQCIEIGGGGSGVGTSSDRECLFNDNGTVSGLSTCTIATTGVVTAAGFVSSAADGARGITMDDNPTAGYTDGAPASGGGIWHMSSFTGTLRPYFLDDANGLHEGAVYLTTGGFRDCVSGQSEIVGVSDNWCVTPSGAAKFKGNFRVFENAVNGASDDTMYNVLQLSSFVETVATPGSEEFYSTMKVLGNDLVSDVRHRIESNGLHFFFPGDGDAGIALVVGVDKTKYVRLFPDAGIATALNVKIPDPSIATVTMAYDGGVTSVSTSSTISDTSMYGNTIIATGVGLTLTLPTAVTNMKACFTNRSTGTLSIKAAATDAFYLVGTATILTDGDKISSATEHATVCIQADEAGNWVMLSAPGTTWTDGGA